MFTTPCFIRKNTPELIEKLEELGYYRHPSYGDNGQYLYLNRGFYHTNVVGYSEEIERMIDCGTNEELFIALAALRDDTDKNQWIIDEANEAFGLDDSLMICDKNDMNDRAIYTHYRKATVEEIIEHFKDK